MVDEFYKRINASIGFCANARDQDKVVILVVEELRPIIPEASPSLLEGHI